MSLILAFLMLLMSPGLTEDAFHYEQMGDKILVGKSNGQGISGYIIKNGVVRHLEYKVGSGAEETEKIIQFFDSIHKLKHLPKRRDFFVMGKGANEITVITEVDGIRTIQLVDDWVIEGHYWKEDVMKHMRLSLKSI